MGRATITGGGEDGRYTISLDVGTAERDARVATIDARIAKLTTQITDANDAADFAQAEADAAEAVVVAAIDAYVQATIDRPDGAPWQNELNNHEAALTNLFNAQAVAGPLQAKAAELAMEKAQRVKEKARLQNLVLQESRPAWCVDLTEDATGEVATIEVPGESTLILISPEGRAAGSNDGRLVSRYVQSPEQVFWNAAVLPGWQKHLPTYRTGVIASIDYSANTAAVELDAATSSAQRLNVNRDDELVNVPVTYMDCDCLAFEVDDRVVVRLQGQTWEGAEIIGFVDNPKPCNWQCVYYYGGGDTYYLKAFTEGLVDELMTTGLVVQYRMNRGPWVSMTYFDNSVNFYGLLSTYGGSNNYSMWRDPAYTWPWGPDLNIGKAFRLSSFYNENAPQMDGIQTSPVSLEPVEAYPGGPLVDPSPTGIMEVRIMLGGELRVNFATQMGTGRILAPGGIHPDVFVYRLVGYQLFRETGD